ncbi:hypothetical protein [Micrococcus sp. IITD107]|uniref:hypothetical protein n=1 Tax=Micrococcus sp. IITD107 TaxID=3342790 RepID=UPI0035B94675
MAERERANQIVIRRRGREKPAALKPWVFYRDARSLEKAVQKACRVLEGTLGITPPDHVEMVGDWRQCRGRFRTDGVEYEFFPVADPSRPAQVQARPAPVEGVSQRW